MKYATEKSILCALVAALAVGGVAHGASFPEIVRTAALRNGLRPAAQLFLDRDSNLAGVGKLFFESKELSLNGNIACQTCHLEAFGSTDGLPNAVGIFGQGEGPARLASKGRIIPRNVLPFWGRGGKGFDTFFWDGKVDFSDGKRNSQFGAAPPSDDPLVIAVHLPPLEVREMLDDDPVVAPYVAENLDAASQLLMKITQHLKEREPAAVARLADALGEPATDVVFLDVARSIAAFIRSEFRVKDTKFHRFVFGTGPLSPDELEGATLFYGKGKCATCHAGPYFSDFEFHAIPFPQLGFGKNGFGVDYGRFNVTFKPDDLYKFRTPPLLNVVQTAPYGHSGSLATLSEAIVGHFDPLRTINPNGMDLGERTEFFKRMAASADSINFIGVLDDEEVEKVEKFLRTLSFK